jgi:hypothetical protein
MGYIEATYCTVHWPVQQLGLMANGVIARVVEAGHYRRGHTGAMPFDVFFFSRCLLIVYAVSTNLH